LGEEENQGDVLSSELFINEFIDAIQHSNLVKLPKALSPGRPPLIDDIQFLGGKERSQEEFFHTFNTLFDGHKQIVLSSDRPASEIANLEHRLVLVLNGDLPLSFSRRTSRRAWPSCGESAHDADQTAR
jgi:chromosomal replication initiator protein